MDIVLKLVLLENNVRSGKMLNYTELFLDCFVVMVTAILFLGLTIDSDAAASAGRCGVAAAGSEAPARSGVGSRKGRKRPFQISPG